MQIGVDEGADLVVNGRGVRVADAADGFFTGASLFDHVTPDMRIYREEVFGPVLAVVRAHHDDHALDCPASTNSATVSWNSTQRWRYRPRFRQSSRGRDGRGRTCRFRYRSPITPSAAGNGPASATSTSTARTPSASTPGPRRSPSGGLQTPGVVRPNRHSSPTTSSSRRWTDGGANPVTRLGPDNLPAARRGARLPLTDDRQLAGSQPDERVVAADRIRGVGGAGGNVRRSGLMVVGFFLPGDTLIFPAGVLCNGRYPSRATPGAMAGVAVRGGGVNVDGGAVRLSHRPTWR